MSGVRCHVSRVRCQVSRVIVEIVGGGSVINRAYSSLWTNTNVGTKKYFSNFSCYAAANLKRCIRYCLIMFVFLSVWICKFCWKGQFMQHKMWDGIFLALCARKKHYFYEFYHSSRICVHERDRITITMHITIYILRFPEKWTSDNLSRWSHILSSVIQ